MRSKKSPQDKRGRAKQGRRIVEVDLASLVAVGNSCPGCRKGEPSCCSTFDVCVTTAEMERIIRVLPEASKYAPQLQSREGFENVFDEAGRGLYSLDTDEDGVCVFAYWVEGRNRCSLHSAAVALGMTLRDVKPKHCMLWPIHVSEGNETLAIPGEVVRFRCNTRAQKGSRRVSPALLDAIDKVYGKGSGEKVAAAAARGERRLQLVLKR